jgi:hypothetical protein
MVYDQPRRKGKGERKRKGRKGSNGNASVKGEKEDNVHSSLLGRSLDQLPPVGRGRVGGHGQALEGVRLEGAGEGAQVVHDGEGLLPRDEVLVAGEGAEEGAGWCCEGCHSSSWLFRGFCEDRGLLLMLVVK